MPIRAPREQKKRRWVWWWSERGDKKEADERLERKVDPRINRKRR